MHERSVHSKKVQSKQCAAAAKIQWARLCLDRACQWQVNLLGTCDVTVCPIQLVPLQEIFTGIPCQAILLCKSCRQSIIVEEKMYKVQLNRRIHCVQFNEKIIVQSTRTLT